MHLGLCENKGLTDPSLSLKDPQCCHPTPYPSFLQKQPWLGVHAFCHSADSLSFGLGLFRWENSLSGLCDLFYPFLCWVLLQEPKSSCCKKTAETVWTLGNFFEDRETCQTAREKGSYCVDLFSLVYGGKKYFTHN